MIGWWPLRCAGTWKTCLYERAGLGERRAPMESDSAAEPSLQPQLLSHWFHLPQVLRVSVFQTDGERNGMVVAGRADGLHFFKCLLVHSSSSRFLSSEALAVTLAVTVVSFASSLPYCCSSSEGAFGKVLGEERCLASGPSTWSSKQALAQGARLPGREEGHGPTP